MSQFHNRWKALSGEAQDEDDEPNTVKAADAVAEASVGEPVPEEYRKPAGTAVHYGFGALLGTVYGAAVELRPAAGAGFGTGYGAAVSLFVDELAMPALGFTPPAPEVPALAHLRGFVSHLVFGAALEGARLLLLRAIRGRAAATQRPRIFSAQSA
jgi:hypothetical protein